LGLSDVRTALIGSSDVHRELAIIPEGGGFHTEAVLQFLSVECFKATHVCTGNLIFISDWYTSVSS
jgi:hypothetical protein